MSSESSVSSSISSPSSPSSSISDSSSHGAATGGQTMMDAAPLGGLLSQALSSNETTDATEATPTDAAKALLLQRNVQQVVYNYDRSEDNDGFAIIMTNDVTQDPTATDATTAADALNQYAPMNLGFAPVNPYPQYPYNPMNVQPLAAGAGAGDTVLFFGDGDKVID